MAIVPSPNEEKKRTAAWDLATRIRFLREGVTAGRNSENFSAELAAKVEQLAALYDAPPETKAIRFTVRDAQEVPATEVNPSEWVFCRREIDIANPKANPHATGHHSISLLPKGQDVQNLVDAGVSHILPPAYGGI